MLVLGCSSSPAAAPDAAAPADDAAPPDVAGGHDGHDVGAAPDARLVGRCPDGGALPYPAAPEVSFKSPLPRGCSSCA
jgi:hypothetical protein